VSFIIGAYRRARIRRNETAHHRAPKLDVLQVQALSAQRDPWCARVDLKLLELIVNVSLVMLRDR
jgi:hypothetical protein